MQNRHSIQGILSIMALICLTIGWFNLLPPAINHLLSRQVFYFLIGASFFIQAPLLTNKNFVYAMYVAATICILGAFIPAGTKFSEIKTVGLLAGIILSFFSRKR